MLVTLTLTIGMGVGAVENSGREFADYPSALNVGHSVVQPKFDDAATRRYATQLRLAAKRPVNFAGHFILATWGCGAGCLMAGAIDARDGHVTMLPFTVSDWPVDVSEPLTFKADSRLLRVEGSRNERGRGTYFYVFDGSRFESVGSKP